METLINYYLVARKMEIFSELVTLNTILWLLKLPKLEHD